jgi:hypothetical protein
MRSADERKVVRIDEFKAGRDRKDVRSVRLQPDLQEQRSLTPQEISHRFAMLTYLRRQTS